MKGEGARGQGGKGARGQGGKEPIRMHPGSLFDPVNATSRISSSAPLQN
jgi:hypothetical protein